MQEGLKRPILIEEAIEISSPIVKDLLTRNSLEEETNAKE